MFDTRFFASLLLSIIFCFFGLLFKESDFMIGVAVGLVIINSVIYTKYEISKIRREVSDI